MADSVIQATVRKVVEYSVDAIKNQMSYLCCYSSNVQKLADEVEELNNKYRSEQLRVNVSLANSEVITPEVEAWLKKVEDSMTKSNEICDAAEQVERGSTCLCKHSWLPMMHYSLSRKAFKTTNNCVRLRTNNFVVISTPRMLADIPPIPMSTNVSFKSRVSTENIIMDALKVPSVYSIGIWGTGGVGKTVMAKKIQKRVRDEKLFQHVIMVIVTKPLDIPKLRSHIATELSLVFKGDSPISQQKELHERLMDEKRILLILDDIWEKLDLEEIGIPSQSIHAGCKLILTSRNRDALESTGILEQNIFQLRMLNKKESWNFFADNAGIHVNGDDSPNKLVQIAKKVERECKGLPLALKIVASALKGKGLSSWNNSLRELEKHAPVNIPSVIKDVYGPLQFSIDALEGKEQKDLFLLCCLFPEDYSISLEELLRYGVGLGIFMETENLIETRDKVEALLTILVSRSLLLEGEKEHGNVRMHDVIRDVGIWIKKEKFLIKHGLNEWPMGHDDFCNNYTCLSLQFSHQHVSFPESIVFPKLELLCLDYARNELPKNFFSGMGGLRVLETLKNRFLPSSLNQLNNLRTLKIMECSISDTISELGKLINLEMLNLSYCSFEVLPLEIGELKRLKQMNIISCIELRRISYGVLSRLARLEELVILDSFHDWLAEARGEDVACLFELNDLKNLTTLKIEIRNPSAVPREKPLWIQKVVKYSICVPSSIPNIFYIRDEMSKFQNSIALGNDIVNLLGDWVYDMSIDAEYVALAGSSCQKFSKWLSRNYGNMRILKKLSLFELHNIQYLAQGLHDDAIFSKLESLQIENSMDLQQIFEVSPPSGSLKALQRIQLNKLSGLLCLWKSSIKKQLYLGNLQNIKIDQCDNLSYLFSLSDAKSLEKLTNLTITNCRSIKEIFKNEDEKAMEINKLKFPKLQSICFSNLDSFYSLCNDFIGIELPELDSLTLMELPSMNKVDGDNKMAHQEYFNPKFAGINSNFWRLKELNVGSINGNFKCMFSPSIIISGLPNLSSLKICHCAMLEQVVGKENKKVREAIILPNLNELVLSNLPIMRCFCYNAIQFPLLEFLSVEECPLMLKFVEELDNHCSSSRSFLDELVECPNLKELRLSSLSIAEAFSSRFLILPNLNRLKLSNLTNIRGFCYNSIKLPSLQDLEVTDCPLMQNFIELNYHISSSRPFLDKRVECPNLKYLSLSSLSMEEAFSSLFFKSLTVLEVLYIRDCKALECMIANEEEKGGQYQFIETIPLKYFQIIELPKLHRSILQMKHNPKFPLLEQITVEDCPMLEKFSFESLHFPNLQLVKGFSNCEFYLNFFIAKMVSFEEIYSFNNCFIISIKDIAFKGQFDVGDSYLYILTPHSRERFLDAIWIKFWPQTTIVFGKFKMEKIQEGMEYEVMLMILMSREFGWEDLIKIELKLPQETKLRSIETLVNHPTEKWITISVGKFVGEPQEESNQDFEFFLDLSKINPKYRESLWFKGIRIVEV